MASHDQARPGGRPERHVSGSSAASQDAVMEKGAARDESAMPFLTIRTFFMAVLVSMGGMTFGYDTGQISGFLEMDNFKQNFAQKQPNGDYKFSNVRSGLIVAMLSIGTLVGALVAAPIANMRLVGRKYSVCLWCIVFSVGIVIQIAAIYPHWYQVVIGRVVAGLGVGALSVLVPMYQGESAPSHVRGAIVCCYQLFITIGILIAYLINFGTEGMKNTASWRIVLGVSWVWVIILGVGILLFPETPRFNYRHGKVDEARTAIARFHGVPEKHSIVDRQFEEMDEKMRIEQEAGKRPWYEILTGPRMGYRIALGLSIQALQQLTGANFFFYYGTTIFESVGLKNSYVTQIILGAVNVGMTFPGLYMVEKFGRRKCLTAGALWQFMCFLVFASIGKFKLNNADGTPNKSAGYVMIVFACLFIASFASTWGPQAWAVIAEIYPSQYRSQAISLCSASNWTFNFLLAFFTVFITSDIGFAYGYVFAGCNLAAFFIVYFFLPESAGRSLEEIDTMYLLHVTPWKSSHWKPPSDLVTADRSTSLDKKQIVEGDSSQIENRPAMADTSDSPIVGSNRDHLDAGVRGDSLHL